MREPFQLAHPPALSHNSPSDTAPSWNVPSLFDRTAARRKAAAGPGHEKRGVVFPTHGGCMRLLARLQHLQGGRAARDRRTESMMCGRGRLCATGQHAARVGHAAVRTGEPLREGVHGAHAQLREEPAEGRLGAGRHQGAGAAPGRSRRAALRVASPPRMHAHASACSAATEGLHRDQICGRSV